MDYRHGPKQDEGTRFAQSMRKVIQVDIVFLCIHGVPSEVRTANGDRIAVPRNDSELVGKILSFDGGLNGAVGESIAANRLQNEPALNETGSIGRLFCRMGMRKRGRR